MRCARLQYVTESFNSSSLFHKALKEAFEAFCNKAVGGLASAELMANFCNTLLSKTVGLSILVHMCAVQLVLCLTAGAHYPLVSSSADNRTV